jgi:integrase
MGRDILVGNGLYKVIQKSGFESWAVRYRSPVNGRQVKVTLGNCVNVTPKDARKRAQTILGQVASGVDPVSAQRDAKGELWEAVVERYLRQCREHNRKSTVYASTRILMGLDWHGRRVGTIKWCEIAAVLDVIKARGAPIMANRTFDVLRHMFNFAVEHELLRANPCDRHRAPSKELSRDRVLSDPELAKIWVAADNYPYGLMVRMLMLTGQRRDEVRRAVWDEFQEDVWHLPAKRTKNGRAHDVPLSSQVVEVLAGIPRFDEHLFIHSSGGSLSRHKIKLDAACGVEGWTIHDLRRTMASGMARLGVPIHVIEKCINHVSGTLSGVAGVYNRYSYEKEKRGAMQKWGDHIASLVS